MLLVLAGLMAVVAMPLRWQRWCVVAVAIWLGCLTGAGPVGSVRAAERVLIIDDQGASRPAFVQFMEGFRAAVADAGSRGLDVYLANLDLDRLTTETDDPQYVAEWLLSKYRRTSFDFIVATSQVTRDFCLRNLAATWPGACIVGVERPGTPPAVVPDDVAYTYARAASPLGGTVAVAMQLFPASQRVAYVAQSNDHRGYHVLQAAATERAAREAGIEFVHCREETPHDLQARLASLPGDSFVLFIEYWAQTEKGVVVPAELLERLCPAISVPVFGISESYLGRGVVGGDCASPRAIGEAVGRLVLESGGGRVADPVVVPCSLMFDSRALARFDVSPSRLPSGSQVLFEEPTFWQRYWLQAVSLVAMLVLETGLIAGLVLNLRRRISAERTVEEQRELLMHTGRVSALGEFAASLAHELGQPLGAILNSIDTAGVILDRDPLGPEEREELRAILDDMALGERRAGDVLDRLRAMVRKQRFTIEEIEPLQVLRDLQTLAGPRCRSAGITLNVSCEPGLPPIAGDMILLQQGLLNLISNAIEAITARAGSQRSAGSITVAAGRHDDRVTLSVADDGGGVAGIDLEQIREPFFTTKSEGLGVGLAIVQSIMEQHEGSLHLENRAGYGLTVQLFLPIWCERTSS